jgi:cyclopropane-fatty-acyl-phospholipid synthase
VICEKLKLKPGDKVLEIGTGWGGLALYAAQHYGCEITTTTISEAQYSWAHQAIQSANLGHKIHLLKEDYRMLTGRYDKIVSIEMIEAVGHRYLGTYLKKLASLLTENGQILIQAICISDQHYERAKYEADFIKQYIFPGGFLPSLTAIASTLTEKTNLRIIGVEDIGLHYAKTLFDWRQRFIEATNQIMAMGYSLIFFRMWIYYLCYCEAAFLEQYISDFQIVMIKSGN